MIYYDRKRNEIVEEIEYQKKSLTFLYETKVGRFLLKSFIARPWFSDCIAKYQKSSRSKKDILRFVEKYNINCNSIDEFGSFNDFFIRKKNILHSSRDNELISVADSKLSYFPITDDLRLHIKQSNYSIAEILGDDNVAADFAGGICLVHRLAVSDNHRYIYIDDGEILSHKRIPGELHTIRSISHEFNVYSRNSREVTILNTKNLGKIACVEVGALLVGKIVNNHNTPFGKNDEKGYFEFGGSTIVILLNKNIKMDDDIERMNANNIEVLVEAGERIGLIC